MNKSRFNDVVLCVYAHAIATKDYGIPLRITQSTLAPYLKMSRQSLFRHLQSMLQQGFIAITETSTKVSNGKIKTVNVYDANLDRFEQWFLDHNIEKPSLYQCSKVHSKACEFAKAYKHLEDHNIKIDVDMSQKEKIDVVNRKIETKKQKKLLAQMAECAEIMYVFPELEDDLEYLRSNGIEVKFTDYAKKRPVNRFVATANPEKHPEDQSRLILGAETLGVEPNHILEHDFSSSTYRIQYGLGNNCVPQKDDYYLLIINETIKNHPEFGNVLTKDEFKGTIRDDCKATLFQQTTMNYSALTYSTYQERDIGVWNSKTRTRSKSTKEKYEEGTLSEKERILFEQQERVRLFFGQHYFYDVAFHVAETMKHMFNMNRFLESKIFFFEGRLYIRIQRMLLERNGIKTFLVYDALYHDDSVSAEDFDKLVEQYYEEAFTEMITNPKVHEYLKNYIHTGEWKEKKQWRSKLENIDTSFNKPSSFLLPKPMFSNEEWLQKKDFFIKRAQQNPEDYVF